MTYAKADTLSQSSSLRIAMLRFPLIALVVFLHAFSRQIAASDPVQALGDAHTYDYYVRYFISTMLARVAVPLYFIMAGYLLEYGVSFTWKKYGEKLRSRIPTLLYPLIFWNVLVLCLFLAVELTPQGRALLSGNNKLVVQYSVMDYVNAVFGVTDLPLAYQFWFVRDLIALSVLWPAIRILLQYSRNIILLIPAIIWFLPIAPQYNNEIQALLFFTAGVALALGKKDLFSLDKFGTYIAAAYAVALVADISTVGRPFNLFIHNIDILLGCSTALFATKFCLKAEKLRDVLLALSPASFFVFAAHEPMLTFMRKVAYKALHPHSSEMILVIYFVLPTVIICLLTAAYFLLNKIFPAAIGFITGGRQRRQPAPANPSA